MKMLQSFTFLFLVLCFFQNAHTSTLKKLKIDDLTKRSTHVVVGKVVDTSIQSKDQTSTSYQITTIQVIEALKGSLDTSSIKLKLYIKGLKGFDEPLTMGQIAVFFLHKHENNQYTLTHPGGIAHFTYEHLIKNN